MAERALKRERYKKTIPTGNFTLTFQKLCIKKEMCKESQLIKTMSASVLLKYLEIFDTLQCRASQNAKMPERYKPKPHGNLIFPVCLNFAY